MATYVIGDIQGCFVSLQALLTQVGYDPIQDRIWLTGDLVNRGPKSLEVLRWAKAQGDRLVTVLGNHDLHLLACHSGAASPQHCDSFEKIIKAPDRNTLMDWLRHQPMLFGEDDYLLVHAGLLPCWSDEDAHEMARKIEDNLRGPNYATLLKASYKKPEPQWGEDLSDIMRMACAIHVMARMRLCTSMDTMDLSHKGRIEEAPEGSQPWFTFHKRNANQPTIIFGHWAALGLHQGPGLLGLDTGCVWGRQLTAFRLDDGQFFHQENLDRISKAQ